jgi:hypothetical protein
MNSGRFAWMPWSACFGGSERFGKFVGAGECGLLIGDAVRASVSDLRLAQSVLSSKRRSLTLARTASRTYQILFV